MRLLNRKTLLGSALTLAAAVFALDRFSGGGPRAADAAAGAAAGRQPQAAGAGEAATVEGRQGAAASAPPAREDAAALLRRIEAERAPMPALDLEDISRDPFVVSGALRAALAGGAGGAAGSAAATQPAEADVAFEKRHKLQGVVMGPVRLAVIDGEPYRVGEAIDGYTLIDIRREHAVLRGRGGVVILPVAREHPAAAR